MSDTTCSPSSETANHLSNASRNFYGMDSSDNERGTPDEEQVHPSHEAPATTLPQELIDSILETVVRSQSYPRRKGCNTVGQCMLVSRSFLTSVRRYLFEHITIRDARKAATLGALPPSETARMEGLLAIFRADPLLDSEYPLVSHVRSIKMVMDSAESKSKEIAQGGGSLLKDASSAVLDWNARRVNMREVLRAVTHLERFALEFLAPISGHSIHVGISLAIEKVCQSAALTRLEFANIYHFPVDLLASCANLRYLRLLNVCTGNPETDSTSAKGKKYAPTLLPAVWSRQSLQKLEVLETENSGDVLEEIAAKAFSGFSFSRVKLKAFRLGLPTKAGLDNVREVAVMRQTASSLESLTIHGITSDISMNICPGRLSLSDLKNLRSLHLHLSFPSMSLFGQMPPSLDLLLGEQVHSPTSIETITFDVTVKVAHFNSKFSTLKLETDPAWSTIDHHLTNGSQYPVLRQVIFRLLIFHQQLLPTPLLPTPDSWEELTELKRVITANLQDLTDKLFQAVAQSQRIKYDFSLDFSEALV